MTDDASHDPGRWSPDAHARWLHELRNAVGTAGVALRLGRRALAEHDETIALELIERADDALDCCRRLLSAETAGDRPAATPVPTSPRAHR